MFSFLSPCVLPLVPGYLSLMLGVGAPELAVATRTDTRRPVRSTLRFVAGAFGWTPCIGPVLAPILGFAADQSTVAKGIVLLLFYSLGLGVPFVVSGVGFARLTGAFAWVKRHYTAINLVAGLLLVAFGV